MERMTVLEEKNQQLSALYRVTAFLHESNSQRSMAQKFLDDITLLSRADAGCIRLLDKHHRRLEYIATKNLPDSFVNSTYCTELNCYCGKVAEHANQTTLYKDISVTSAWAMSEHSPCINSPFKQLINFCLYYKEHHLGIMTLFFKHRHPQLLRQTQELIETLTKQLAIALENQQWIEKDKQQAVMQERNLMAQGLHDGVAQVLSFLNLQTQMMQQALKSNDISQAGQHIDFIQQGIQTCYEDVRELLLNFRTRVDGDNFTDAVQLILARFKQQTNMQIELTLVDTGSTLNPQQQMQVTFILQEALSNVRKHAQSNQVTVSIVNEADFVMRIEDNGCGFSTEHIKQKQAQHVGIAIMQERARQIQGQITISSTIDKGTQVTFTLSKAHRGML